MDADKRIIQKWTNCSLKKQITYKKQNTMMGIQCKGIKKIRPEKDLG